MFKEIKAINLQENMSGVFFGGLTIHVIIPSILWNNEIINQLN